MQTYVEVLLYVYSIIPYSISITIYTIQCSLDYVLLHSNILLYYLYYIICTVYYTISTTNILLFLLLYYSIISIPQNFNS